jgi:3-phytase
MLLVFDGTTGTLLRTVGSPGTGPGQLGRPNGIAVVGDLALVVERDNHRIQVFTLPDFGSAGTFGQDALRRPYGLAVVERGAGFDLFVTDNYETASGETPPDAELGERVKRFRVSAAEGKVVASHVASFGAVTGEGVLRTVESIAADPERNRLLIAEEGADGRGIRVYTVDGAYTGTTLGSDVFAAEPEGIALLACSRGGYWITTEQRLHRSVFHVFSRESLEHLGSFSGGRVANTDGIAVTPDAVDRRGAGWFFAVDNDRAVAAFPWPGIAAALGLDAPCAVSGRAP